MTKLGRVYTFVVAAPLDKVADIVATLTDGATMQHGVGLWKGQREAVTIVYIATTQGIGWAETVAATLARAFKQECVYLECDGVGYTVDA